MPQKRNPDSMELLRGKAARFQASLTHLLTLTKGLPLTYNRDLQDDKPPLFDAADQLILSVAVADATLAGTKFHKARCLAAASPSTPSETPTASILGDPCLCEPLHTLDCLKVARIVTLCPR
jgi:argininosuccinate lyase